MQIENTGHLTKNLSPGGKFLGDKKKRREDIWENESDNRKRRGPSRKSDSVPSARRLVSDTVAAPWR